MRNKMNTTNRRERRNKLEIYFDILNSIIEESRSADMVRPTRVQFLSNLSYDNLSKHLVELKEKKMLHDSEIITLTEKGKKFVKDYEKIRSFTERMGLDYL